VIRHSARVTGHGSRLGSGRDNNPQRSSDSSSEVLRNRLRNVEAERASMGTVRRKDKNKWMGRDGTGRDGTGRDGTGLGWDGTGRDGTAYVVIKHDASAGTNSGDQQLVTYSQEPNVYSEEGGCAEAVARQRSMNTSKGPLCNICPAIEERCFVPRCYK
jgi:hypothetical protein